MAFAMLGIVELAGQRRRAAAARAVAHDDDLFDLELGHREFQRRRNAVVPAAGLERRGEVGDVADDEDLARVGIEDDRRLDPAVASRQ